MPEVIEALYRLSSSGLFHGLTDRLRSRGGLASALDSVRWTAGMIAQWVALEELRALLRDRLSFVIQQFQPDIVLAHSLGSLIAYDTLRPDEVAGGTLAKDLTFVSFGSQIGNPAVRSVFGGRIEPLESCRFWWHLFNAEDDVFTCPVGLPSVGRFRQVDTFFDLPGFADHEGASYLGHEQTALTVWQDLAATAPRGRAVAAGTRPTDLAQQHARIVTRAKPPELKQKAVLVGVADYPEAQNRLEGPVNDVFAVSAALQELGFPVDGIRVVLNERATGRRSASGCAGCWRKRARATSCSSISRATARRCRATAATPRWTGSTNAWCPGTSTGAAATASPTTNWRRSTASFPTVASSP
ncbi:caspase family protein [Ramlibacter sp. B156]|uniref:Caspase family protein n=1 Tax=Ramlibacter montanisoli TaxID=2732512 RepID=A0A849K740_9BURK|nr:caspase family protein [Ramlibacter montanisoli]